jgi:hypothetical protein
MPEDFHQIGRPESPTPDIALTFGGQRVGLGHCGIEAGPGDNLNATIKTTAPIMPTSRQRPVRDGTVVSTTGDGLIGPNHGHLGPG